MSKTSSKNSAAFTASSISNYQSAFPNIPRLCSLSSGFGGASWHSRSIGATWLYQVGLTFPHSNCPWQQFHLQREQGPSQDTKEMWKRDWQRGSKEGLQLCGECDKLVVLLLEIETNRGQHWCAECGSVSVTETQKQRYDNSLSSSVAACGGCSWLSNVGSEW